MTKFEMLFLELLKNFKPDVSLLNNVEHISASIVSLTKDYSLLDVQDELSDAHLILSSIKSSILNLPHSVPAMKYIFAEWNDKTSDNFNLAVCAARCAYYSKSNDGNFKTCFFVLKQLQNKISLVNASVTTNFNMFKTWFATKLEDYTYNLTLLENVNHLMYEIKNAITNNDFTDIKTELSNAEYILRCILNAIQSRLIEKYIMAKAFETWDNNNTDEWNLAVAKSRLQTLYLNQKDSNIDIQLCLYVLDKLKEKTTKTLKMKQSCVCESISIEPTNLIRELDGTVSFIADKDIVNIEDFIRTLVYIRDEEKNVSGNSKPDLNQLKVVCTNSIIDTVKTTLEMLGYTLINGKVKKI